MEGNSFRKGVKTLKKRGMSHKGAVNKMRYYSAKNKNQGITLSPQASMYLLLILAFTFLGIKKETMDILFKLFAGALTAMITSSAASGIAENLGLEFLKQHKIEIKIGYFYYSWRAFAIVVIFKLGLLIP